MNLEEAEQRKKDLEYAVRMTSTYLRSCDTPDIRDLHINAIKYYNEQIVASNILIGLLMEEQRYGEPTGRRSTKKQSGKATDALDTPIITKSNSRGPSSRSKKVQ